MNTLTKPALGTTVRLNTDFDTAVQRVTDALKTEGFGVLTEIDVKATLKKKLDLDFRPYRILGACNPKFAHQALELAPEVGLLLPCNVTVAEAEPGVMEVSIVNPVAMLSVIDNPAMKTIAEEVKTKLDRVAAVLRG